jgi:hypothetical protein
MMLVNTTNMLLLQHATRIVLAPKIVKLSGWQQNGGLFFKYVSEHDAMAHCSRFQKRQLLQ